MTTWGHVENASNLEHAKLLFTRRPRVCRSTAALVWREASAGFCLQSLDIASTVSIFHGFIEDEGFAGRARLARRLMS